MSSNFWNKSGMCVGGIFSEDSILRNETLIYVPYCTSDSWTGNSKQSSSFPFVFRGSQVVQYLRNNHINEILENSQQIIFSGCSAGGRGSLYNLDQFCQGLNSPAYSENSTINPHLRDHSIIGTQRCIGFADAAWWIVEDPFSKSVPSLRDVAILGTKLWNASIAMGKCPSPVDCFFGSTLFALIDTPFVVHSESYDAFQLPWNVNHGPPFSTAEQEYADEFSIKIHASLETSLGPGVATGKTGVFSPSCYAHCITLSSAMFQISVGGITLHNVLIDWLGGKGQMVLETCKGMGCSVGC